MNFKSVIVLLIVCTVIPSIVHGFFLRRPEHEDPRHDRFDIFIQELVKFKIRMIKNIIYPLLVEIPWKKLFEPEKFHHEQMMKKRNNSRFSFDQPPRENLTEDVDGAEPPSLIRNNFPTEEMIRLSMPDDGIVMQDSAEEYDEVELLKAIPEIVEHMRQGRVTHEERLIMHSIYGELWPLIEEEARRDPRRAMNPILRAIFNSRELQMTTVVETRKPRTASNDIFWNSLSTINHAPKGILRQKRHNVDISARLMDTVAILVRESLRGSLKSPKQELERKKRMQKQRRKITQKHSSMPEDVLEAKKASFNVQIVVPKTQ